VSDLGGAIWEERFARSDLGGAIWQGELGVRFWISDLGERLGGAIWGERIQGSEFGGPSLVDLGGEFRGANLASDLARAVLEERIWCSKFV